MNFAVGDRIRLRDDPWGNDWAVQQAGLKLGVEYVVESIPVDGRGVTWVGIRGYKNPQKRFPGWAHSRFELAPKKKKAMPEFDGPGEGWREVPVHEVRYPYVSAFAEEGLGRYWVPEKPVPPLPTERMTVIETESGTYIRGDRGWSKVDWVGYRTDAEMRERITGFEVLAEPVTEFDTDREVFERRVRRETAKAVHAYLLTVPDYYGADRVARKFEITS